MPVRATGFVLRADDSAGRVMATMKVAGSAVILALMCGVAEAQQTWVAVADDGDRYFGYAVGMATREAAEGAALGSCGNGCSVKLTAIARCVAYAHSDTGHASGYSAGVDLDVVRQVAWSDCNRRVPANSCTVKVAQCWQ